MAAAATSLGGVFSPPPSTTARLTLPNRPFLFTPRKLLSPPTTTLLSSRILCASQKSLEQDPVEAQIVASEATETPKGEGFFAILMELRLIRDNGNYPTMKFHEHARYLMDKASEHIGSATICGGLKLALLVGLLTCQGSQLAVASTEFSGAAQINTYIGDLGDISTGFASAFLLIFFSELGDKTFFIAALLAARNSGAVVFIGTFGALAAMSIISVILGRSFHYVDGILPFRFGETDFPIDDFAAVCLLVYFGVTTLLEAASGDGFKINEEKKEAEVAISEVSGDGAGIIAAANTVISTFLLVFVAEWGDKSFFSTIALAAASSPLGVIGGALAGHALATLLAVLGGSILGTFLSEKVVAYIGGSLFLVFAAVTLVDIVS